MADSLDTQPI